jgi:hypothetical protein
LAYIGAITVVARAGVGGCVEAGVAFGVGEGDEDVVEGCDEGRGGEEERKAEGTHFRWGGDEGEMREVCWMKG